MPLLTVEQSKLLCHNGELSRRDKALILLATFDSASSPAAIKARAKEIGLREVAKWNVSDVLASTAGHAIRTEKGWELHPNGQEFIRGIAARSNINLVVTAASSSLRKHLTSIQSPQTAAFVGEAITCLEAHQYRAAVVFSWVGAMSLIYDTVYASNLAAFNAEAARRNNKWKIAKNTDDLTKMGEHDFLDVAEAIGVIGRNVKQTLQNHCLQLRNSCGHPNTLQIAENSAAAHIEKLILNVFTKF